MELGYERPTLISGSATPSITGPTYRGDAVYESLPHVCMGKREPPPDEGVMLVDPILRSSSQVDLTGIVDGVMGPSRESIPTHGFDGGGGGSHSTISGNSPAPLLPPGVMSSPTPPLLTLVNLSGPHTATPT
jgi:hypothetical protein